MTSNQLQKKNKKDKKLKDKSSIILRTLEERTTFVNNIKAEFLKMGCYPGVYPAANKFFKILDDYHLDGTSASGKINFPECPYGGREICYLLSNRANIENVVHFLLKEQQKC
jgi:hypothetical protein